MHPNNPALVPILARIEAIVYEQERRIDGDRPTGPDTALTDMDEETLDAALHHTETAACRLADTTGMHTDAAAAAHAHIHAALMDYADALTQQRRIKNPRDTALAAAETARLVDYTSTLIAHPRALDMVDTLDRVEQASSGYAHDADEAVKRLDAIAEAALRIAPWTVPAAAAEPHRTRFIVYLGAYRELRAGVNPDRYADHLMRTAAELDTARERLAAAYVDHLDTVNMVRLVRRSG